MFANTQYCWQHYIIYPCCQPVFPISAFVFKYLKIVLVAQLKRQISLLGTPAKKFENPSSTI